MVLVLVLLAQAMVKQRSPLAQYLLFTSFATSLPMNPCTSSNPC